MFAPVRTVAPAVLLTPAEAKAHLRVDHADDDALIAALIEAATTHLDGWSGILGRALVSQTWRQDFADFGEYLRLPLGPVVSVSSVTYYDINDASQTAASASYSLLADDYGPYVGLVPGYTWPSVSSTRNAPVSVTYVAGYGTAAAVPQAIKQAALLLIAHWYDFREAVMAGQTPTELPFGVRALLTPFRRVGL